jgi:hypothetical protein
MEGGDGPGKLDRVANINVFKEKEMGIMAMSTKVRFRVF